MFTVLSDLNNFYNNLSKHFSIERRGLFEELTYGTLKQLVDTTANIWLWVCRECHRTNSFDRLFLYPAEYIRPSRWGSRSIRRDA